MTVLDPDFDRIGERLPITSEELEFELNSGRTGHKPQD